MSKHWTLLVLSLWLVSPQALAELAGSLTYQWAFLRAEFSKDQPAFVALAVDSLGKGKLSVNPLLPPALAPRPFEARRRYGHRVEYRLSGAPPSRPPVWVFETSTRQMSIQSSYVGKRIQRGNCRRDRLRVPGCLSLAADRGCGLRPGQQGRIVAAGQLLRPASLGQQDA